MSKLTTVQEAVSHIKDGDILAISGMLLVAGCEPFYEALEERFLETGSPKNLTLFACSSIGGTGFKYGLPPDLANRLAHSGLVAKIVTSLYNTMPCFHAPVLSGDVEGYLVPQGTFSQMIHASARRIPRTLTRMGLHTFVDPRYGGGKLSNACKDDLCEVVFVDNEEFLSYKTIYPDVCILRGTAVDVNGNITMEEECGEFDALALATATHLNGGKVIVQVQRQTDVRANPQLVKIPAELVDYVYIHPRQSLKVFGKNDPRMNGVVEADSALLDRNASFTNDVPAPRRAILERACRELRPGQIANAGIGMPYFIPMLAHRLGITGVTFTNEVGLWGGCPEYSTFGLNYNTGMMTTQQLMQSFYEGAGLDIAFAGALEVDIHGNVNVAKKQSKLVGIGGFNSTTAAAKTVVFCFEFLDSRGRCKIVPAVECVNYNAEHGPSYQQVLYVTDRAVFAVKDNCLTLREVMPGYDINDILPYLPEGIKTEGDNHGTFCNC